MAGSRHYRGERILGMPDGCQQKVWMANGVAPTRSQGGGTPGSVLAENQMHRALLVGVNEYAKQTRLSGSVDDVIAAQQLLVSQGVVAPAHMIVLMNADATKSALVDALIEMVDALEPGDCGFFHFSGHSVRMDLHDP